MHRAAAVSPKIAVAATSLYISSLTQREAAEAFSTLTKYEDFFFFHFYNDDIQSGKQTDVPDNYCPD